MRVMGWRGVLVTAMLVGGMASLLAAPPVAGEWKSTLRETFRGRRLDVGKWTDAVNPNTFSSSSYGVQYQCAVVKSGRLRLALYTAPPQSRNPHLYRLAGGPVHTSRLAQQYGYFAVTLRAPAHPQLVAEVRLAQVRDTGRDREEITLCRIAGNAPERLTVGARCRKPDTMQPFTRDIPCANLAQSFHTVALAWLPEGLTWYLDGREIASTPHAPAEKMALECHLFPMETLHHRTDLLPAEFLIDEVEIFAKQDLPDTAAPLACGYRFLTRRNYVVHEPETVVKDNGAPSVTIHVSVPTYCYGIDIAFDEPVEKSSAEIVANYTLGYFAPHSAELLKDGRTVRLRWPAAEIGACRSALSVTGVRDRANNTMPRTALRYEYP